ncbi:MAG: hypothetical protein ACRDGM_10325, partial [bacterium]
MIASQLFRGLRTSWWDAYGIVVAVYVAATLLTDAYFMGDTWGYVSSILRAETLRANFWDFSHPLWHPFGWLVAQALYPLYRVSFGEDPYANVLVALLAINWLAGLAGSLLVHAVARMFCTRRWAAYLVTMAFLFSNAILNYAQTG